MRRARLFGLLYTVLILVGGCSRAIEPVLVEVLKTGTPFTVVNPDANGNYPILPNGFPIVEVRFPLISGVKVAVDGSVLEQAEDPQQQSTLQSQDIGYYSVISSNADSNTGLADYQIKVIPAPSKRLGPSIEIEVTDYSVDPTNVASDLASPPLRIKVVAAVLPAVGTHQAMAFLANNCQFLNFLYNNSSADAEAYYSEIDPTAQKTSLQDWKTVNGFNSADDSGDDAKATYFNAADLNFGRSMHLKSQVNPDGSTNAAYYVSNYPTVEDARLRTNLLATVAMDYSPVNGGKPFVKFYVYNQTGARVDQANLDGCGQKAVPGLCEICHAGIPYSPGSGGDVGARFLPFDLDNFEYSTASGLGRADQELVFNALNTAILSANPSAAETELIQGWYGGSSSSTQNSGFFPAGWQQTEDPDFVTAFEGYFEAVKPYCRTCHVARDGIDALNSQPSFVQVLKNNRSYVCGPSPVMPNAKVPYLRFWLKQSDALASLGFAFSPDAYYLDGGSLGYNSNLLCDPNSPFYNP
jgi:hypothetical protein